MDNKVELLGYYGSDEVIACSAWTSTSRNLTDEKRGRIQRLIEMLWVNGHETPFEKGSVEVEGKAYEYDTVIALRPNTTDHFNLTKEDWKPLMGLKYGRYQSYLTETFAICAEEDIKVSNQAYEIIDISELYESDGVPKNTDDIIKYFGTSLKNVVPMLKRTIIRRLERLKKAKS